MHDSQWYPEKSKALSDQVRIRHAFLTFLHFWFLCKYDLISCLSEKNEKFKQINIFQKCDGLFRIFDQIRATRVPLN